MNEIGLEFASIYTEFHPKIQRYLTRLVGEYEAEDLTQEVFFRISQGLPTFRGESKLSTWIYRIATNAALDRLRTPAYKRIVQNNQPRKSETGDVEIEEKEAWMGEDSASPEQKLWHKQRYECYRDTIENLPVNYRTVVALSELDDLAANEIAEILGLSVDVVKIRLHRGRARLLKELKTLCKAEDWL
jgi:RNA polymerase sigma-70 factor (ECF subfamily)